MGLESRTSAKCLCPWDNIVRIEAFANSDAWAKCNGSPKAKNQSYPRCENVGLNITTSSRDGPLGDPRAGRKGQDRAPFPSPLLLGQKMSSFPEGPACK